MKKHFQKEFSKNKIYYYLPNGTKRIYTTYRDKTSLDTNIQRAITYNFINDILVLIEDSIEEGIPSIFSNYHTITSTQHENYVKKLNEYQNNNVLIDDDSYYSIDIISY